MASFADLPGEVIMLIARFRPHPCAEIMQELYSNLGAWSVWIERMDRTTERVRCITMVREYERERSPRAKRARLKAFFQSMCPDPTHRDALTMLRLECEAEARYYGLYD